MSEQEKNEKFQFERELKQLSMTGRFCYLFMCIETYLITLYPEKNWTPVVERCWQWTKNYWNKGWDIYSVVVPEFLFESENYEQANIYFDGALSEKDYTELINLFTGLTNGNPKDEINQVLMMPIDFSNKCEGAHFFQASDLTMPIFHDMRRIFGLRDILLPDISRVKNLSAETEKEGQAFGWGILWTVNIFP